MNNNSNVYDIDGTIIRQADDEHKWTIDEVKEKIEYYRKKLQDLAEDDKKAVYYATYMRNLTNYLLVLYSQMPADQLNAEIEKAKQDSKEEQIQKAMQELQDDINNDGTTTESTIDEVLNKPTTDNESTTNEESGDAIPLNGGNSDIHEEPAEPESSVLEQIRPESIMDSYVDFEEVTE